MELGRPDATVLDPDRYDRLRRAAETHREHLMVRLGGEVGLRPSEIVAVKPGDVVTRTWNGSTPRFLTVQGGDRPREAYLPDDVHRELRRHVRSNDLRDDEPVFDVTPRRIQMIVASVGDRAADAHGDPALGEVSSADLRRYYARSLLADRGIHPAVVMAVGGWSRLESLAPYLTEPTEEDVTAAFAAESGIPEDRPGPRSHDRLDRLGSVHAVVGSIEDAVPAASSREALLSDVCTRLAESSAYEFAWVSDAPADRPPDLRTRAGLDGRSFEAIAGSGDDDWSRLAVEALETGQVRSAPVDVDSVSRGTDAETETANLVVAPLTWEDTTYGTLAVGASGRVPVSETELAALSNLTDRLGHALAAVEWKRLLFADSILDLEFASTDDGSFFVVASREPDCQFELEGLVVEGQSVVHYVTVRDAEADRVLERASAAGVDARLIAEHSDESLVEVRTTGASLTGRLVELGGSVRQLVAEGGEAHVTCEVATDTDVRSFVAALLESFPESELLAKRESEGSARSATEFRRDLENRLTAKQRSVLRAAYHSGYFDWPRGSTAEELADSIGVSAPTLHNHLRRAQRKVLGAFFGVGNDRDRDRGRDR
jgi:predicted DNA binding protein